MDFGPMGFASGATEDGGVLRVNENLSSIYGSVPRDNPVTEEFLLVHTKILTLMLGQHVHFHKAPWIHNMVDPFPGRHFPHFTLLFQAFFTAASQSFRLFFLKLGQLLFPSDSFS
jgi:hypothetical protein